METVLHLRLFLHVFCCHFIQAERPDAMLGVICGAVHVAEAAISKKYVNFKSALERYDLSVSSLFTSRFCFHLHVALREKRANARGYGDKIAPSYPM